MIFPGRDMVEVFDGERALQFLTHDEYGNHELRSEFANGSLLITGIPPNAMVLVGYKKDFNQGTCESALTLNRFEGPSIVIRGLDDGQDVRVRVRKADRQGCMIPHDSEVSPGIENRVFVRGHYMRYERDNENQTT